MEKEREGKHERTLIRSNASSCRLALSTTSLLSLPNLASLRSNNSSNCAVAGSVGTTPAAGLGAPAA